METLAKILVVDDEDGICSNIEKILSKNNFEVTVAGSAEEALEKMALDSYSLLISDIVMPGINGLDLLKLVKDQWPVTKAIMMTAYASTDTAVEAIQLGANDYIAKPFTPNELRNRVFEALDTRKPGAVVPKIEVKEEKTEDMANYCSVGCMLCDIFEKTGSACKASTKLNACPQKVKAAKKQKSAGRVLGPEMPFDFDDIVESAGEDYALSLKHDGFSNISYESLKTSVMLMMEEMETKAKETEKAIEAQKGLIGVDQPFSYNEVVSVTGPEYVNNLNRDGVSVIEFSKLKDNKEYLQREAEIKKALANMPAEPSFKKILVVDDEVSVNNNVKKILSKSGYSVDQAVSKKAALDKIKERDYSLILLDLRIPGVAGLELLQAIRDTLPEARVIIITGYASIETAVEAAKMGVTSYLQKPFTPNEIRVAAGSALR